MKFKPVSKKYPECPAPHCDSAVLHAPGECTYCDDYPIYQQYRELARIAFTGHEPTEDEVMCPSEVRRGLRDIEAWGGNRKNGDADACPKCGRLHFPFCEPFDKAPVDWEDQ